MLASWRIPKNLALLSGSSAFFQLDGSTAGTGSGHYAQIDSHGVYLDGVTLMTHIGPDYTPTLGNVLTLISNTGPLSGTFSGITTGARRLRSAATSSKSVIPAALGMMSRSPRSRPPLVGVDPTNTTVNAGANASFTSSALGYPVPSAQWQVSTDGGARHSTTSPTAASTAARTLRP